MRKYILTLAIGMGLASPSFGQGGLQVAGKLDAQATIPPPGRTCGTMDYWNMQVQQNPNLLLQRQQMEAQTQNWITNTYNPSQRTVYTIPVVFHVVYNTAAQNISTARLMEQLDVLNKDFRKLNTDVSNVPSAWQGITADCEINFCLATVDPSGNPTTGITRTSTTTTSFSTNDAVKYTASGGHDAWDRNRYLNLWVCNIGGGILGYAQFPGGAAATDGVVLNYAYTGVTGAGAPYNKGRTATHEVGHWLNLYHIWGDDGTACTGSDQVSDTPNQAGEHYGCYTAGTVLTDACTGSAPGVMWMNYMDYTDDACMYMFTNGQKARVQACMAGPRASLATSNGCSAPGTVTANFSANTTSGCSGLTVSFTDQSFGNPTTWNWSFPGGTPASSTQQNPTVTYNTPGTYSVTLITTNGTNGDTLTQTSYITISSPPSAGQALPFSENFESNSWATNNWTIVNPDASTTWAIVTANNGTATNKAAKMDYYAYNAAGQRDAFVTPYLNLSGLSSAQITFEHAYRRYNTSSTDSFVVYIKTSCNGNWVRLAGYGENGSGTFQTANTTTTNWTPSGSNQWCQGAGNSPCYTISLTPYIGNTAVQIKFEGYNNYQNNLYIDNINITGVLAPLAPVANFTASSTTVCAGSSVTFTDQSSNTPTSWSWTFGGGGTPNTSTSQNPSVTFNTPGTYSVVLTATNANGNNTLTRTNYITVVSRPSATLTPTQPACATNNGAVSASVSSGTPSYSYAWSNGGTSASISGLGAGTYTVTVTDANSCTTTQSTTLTAITPPTVAIGGLTNSTCGNANGHATATPSNGTGPFTYVWSNGATTASVTNLPSGAASVTITDARGCTATNTATINNTAGPSLTPSSTNATCGSNNGTASVSISGGTAGFTYAWSNGGSSSSISGLSAGSYTVTVTDANSCTATATANVSSTGGATVNMTGISHTSCGLNNGGATASASGGNPGYSYSWSNGATSASISNVGSGTYSVTVTDQSGCPTVNSVTINASSSPSASISGFNQPSCGINNGSATVSASGGSGGYSYLWSDGQTTATATNLGGGTYSVTVTDGSGCSGTSSLTLNATSAPAASISASTDETCGQGDGSLTVSGSGGTGGYTYLWSDGQATATASNLIAGTYSVTITDGAGCTSTTSGTIANQGGASVSPIVSNISCFGANDGTINANASGGTPSYGYSWSNGSTNAIITNLAPGTYTVTVVDANGCSTIQTATVSEPAALSASTSSTNESAPGANDGTASVTPSGGTSPYSYAWNNGGTAASLTGLAGGTYTVTVTDANGCSTIQTVTVSTLTSVVTGQGLGVKLFPNPNNGTFTLQYSLETAHDLSLKVFNKLGQLVFAETVSTSSQGQVQISLPAMAEGVYYLEATAGDARVIERLVITH